MPQPKTLTLSATRINTFLNCRRRYFFEYEEGLEPIKTPTALSMGRAVHAAIDHTYKGGLAQDVPGVVESNLGELGEWDDPGAREIMRVVASIMMQAWVRQGLHDRVTVMSAEKPFSNRVAKGLYLTGRRDANVVYMGGQYVLENKTSDGLPTEKRIAHLAYDTQASVYVNSAMREGFAVRGILYQFFCKPTIAPYKATPIEKRKYNKANGTLYANMRAEDETLDEYARRVDEWYQDQGEAAFPIYVVTRNEKQIEAFSEQVKNIARDIRDAKKRGTFYPNPAACSVFSCPFAGICLEDTPEVREGCYKMNAHRA